MDIKPHQYPQYKPTTTFSAEFVPNEPAPDQLLLAPFSDVKSQVYPARIGYNDPAKDLETMIYVGNIPPAMPNYIVEQILWACGPVRWFKRVTDYHLKPKRSGFCTFETTAGLIRALRVLGGEGGKDTPELKGGMRLLANLDNSRFTVATDPIARFSLRAARDHNPIEADKQVFDKIRMITAPLDLTYHDFIAPKKHEPVPAPAPKVILDNKDASQETEKQVALVSKAEIEEEAEEERKRAERREQERMLAFQDRQNRWESHEELRLRRVLHDLSLDRENNKKRRWQREHLDGKLADFDDDVEKENEEFYRDRSRWWAKRQVELKREEEQDDRDRRAEAEDHAFARAQEKESADRAEHRRAEADRKAREAKEARVEHKQIEIAQPEGFVVTKIMTKEERVAAIQQIVSMIPAEKEELWSWPVKWDFMEQVHSLTQSILEKTLGPFLTKKIVEIVGDEEKDLVDFILENIRSHADAQTIFDELEPVLDEETEVFVMKLWRMVIYETEARAAGL